MSRSTAVIALAGAVGALAVLGFLMFSGGKSVNAANVGTVPVVAVDTDTTGNSGPFNNSGGAATLGQINPCISVSIETPFDIDIVAQSVPAASGTPAGLTGFQADLTYDGTKLNQTDYNVQFFLRSTPGSATIADFSGSPGIGGTTGAFTVTAQDNNAVNPDTGSGALARITFQATTTGHSVLHLAGVILSGGGPGNTYSVTSVQSADVYVGQACPTGGTPTPTPVPGTPTPTPVPGTPTPTPVPGTPTPTPVPGTPTPTPVPGTPTPTPVPGTPTPTPAPATPTPTHTVAPSITPTLTPTHTASGSPTANVGGTSGTPTPASLPRTGGPSSDAGSVSLLLLLAFGAVLIVAAGGSVLAVRAKHED